jgi:D-alanyl-lipoteichoic acid acyltransferase DltB (MBOAT superfamily)
VLFNTVDFAVFLPIVLLLYWTVFKKSLTLQNIFIVVVSYFFYSCWDWRFLGLIFLSSTVDYTVGLQFTKSLSQKYKKILLFASLFFNLGLLFTFKYFNFFIETFTDAFSFFGTQLHPTSISVILPVGISFYTFQTLSYTIDLYRGKIEPTKNVVQFFAFVSFFPQLVAGPIERASHLLPQFAKKRKFQYAQQVDGLRLILGGLFKKMVIADNCALLANQIFDTYELQSGSTLFIGAVFFAFQIYGDFSGYSDIAIGSSRLLGFDLMKNFNFPYLSQNMSEFWKRWHISLSTWFRDYVYIPLGGSKVTTGRLIVNIVIVFLVSGLWHGANLTFVFWGAIHAVFVIPVILLHRNKKARKPLDSVPIWRQLLNIAGTFSIVVLAWVFFRAPTLTDAFVYIDIIFSSSLFSMPLVSRSAIVFLFLYMCIEWLQRHREHVLDVTHVSKPLRYGIYYVVIFSIFYFAGDLQPFIYFQF